MDYDPAYIMSRFFIDEEIVIDPQDSGSWPIYVGVLPDDETVNDNIVACINTEPLKDGRLFSSGENIWHYGFQLMIRSSDYNTAYDKADELAVSCEGINRNEITISGTTYRLDNVSQTTGIIGLGQEDGSKRRQLFSVNFLVTIKEI